MFFESKKIKEMKKEMEKLKKRIEFLEKERNDLKWQKEQIICPHCNEIIDHEKSKSLDTSDIRWRITAKEARELAVLHAGAEVENISELIRRKANQGEHEVLVPELNYFTIEILKDWGFKVLPVEFNKMNLICWNR